MYFRINICLISTVFQFLGWNMRQIFYYCFVKDESGNSAFCAVLGIDRRMDGVDNRLLRCCTCSSCHLKVLGE